MEKRWNVWMLAMLAFGMVLWVDSPRTMAGEKASKGKVAVVNGLAISQSSFDWEMHRAKLVYGRGRALGGPQLLEIKKRALENLIERELLFQESKKKGIQVDAADVDKQLDTMRRKFPNEEAFKKELGKSNLTEKTFKVELKRAIATQQLVEKEIVSGIAIPENEIKDYYEKNKSKMIQPAQIRASHVLIKVDSKKGPEQKKEAKTAIEKIKAKIKKGEDFAALAKEHSECPSASRGGDLGFFGQGQMVKPFEKAAFALKKDEVSDIVETNFGYHIIKLTDKRPATEVSFKEVRQQIEQHLKQEKVNEAIGRYVAALKKEAKIERLLPQADPAKP